MSRCKTCNVEIVSWKKAFEEDLCYKCSKCANYRGDPRIHFRSSDIGRRHLKYELKEK